MDDAVAACDLLLVVGTSSVVQPAASLAPAAALRGVPVAEFNLERTDTTGVAGGGLRGLGAWGLGV